MSFERRDPRRRFGADFDRWRESRGTPPCLSLFEPSQASLGEGIGLFPVSP
jgi:hypothetical protein